MTTLTWLPRDYDSDVDRAVIYPRGGQAEAWDGLVSVNVNPVSIYELVKHREGHAIRNQRGGRDFTFTVSCFACPEPVLNPRIVFDLSYRIKTDDGSELHLVYNANARPTDSVYSDDDDTPFGLNVVTTPMPMPAGLKPSAHLIIAIDDTPPGVLFALESILYGVPSVEPRLPHPDEIFRMFSVKD